MFDRYVTRTNVTRLRTRLEVSDDLPHEHGMHANVIFRFRRYAILLGKKLYSNRFASVVALLLFVINDGFLAHRAVAAPLFQLRHSPLDSFSTQQTRFASGPSLHFEHLTDVHGLSQNSVYCMLQDRTGFMWFGTQDGLNRYDGYAFTVFRHDPQDTTTISDNYITALYEDRDGKIWVGTQSGGLNRYDPTFETFLSYRHDPQNVESLSHNHVTAIVEDSTGIWVGTKHGLNFLAAHGRRFTRFFPDKQTPNRISDSDIAALHVDRSGVLHIGTGQGGLNRYERASGQFTHFKHDAGDPNSLHNDAVLRIFADRAGVLWLGMGDDVLHKLEWNSASQSSARIFKCTSYAIPASAFVEDHDGTLWIGSNGRGLFRYDRARGSFTQIVHDPEDPASLSDSGILSAWVDRAGDLWLGTHGYGLNQYRRTRKAFQHYVRTPGSSRGMRNRSVRAIYEDEQQRLWIGGYEGLECLERKTGRVIHYQADARRPFSLPSREVFVIYDDPASTGKTFLVGTESRNGLLKFDRTTERFTPYPLNPTNGRSLIPHPIYALHRERSGVLWVGTDNGLFEFDAEKNSLRHYRPAPEQPRGLGHNMIIDLFEEANGTLWIGTNGGLHRLERATGDFVRYQHDPRNAASLGSNRVKCIFTSRDGTLWIGTDGGGLNRFAPDTESFTRYSIRNGLPNDVVYAILEDETGHLWLSTNSGLSRFNPHTLTFRNYETDDGLQGREFNTGAYFKSLGKRGEMFFGGINGVTAFFPDQIKDNPYVPPIVLTGFSKFNQSVRLDTSISAIKKITLDYTDVVFSVQFAALNFTRSEKNQYAFRLQGFHEDWIPLGTKREATFTHLDPGEYVLRVKGSNNDGVWNEAGTSLVIAIPPRFYQTRWFMAFVVLLLSGTIFGGVRWRMHHLDMRQIKLEALVAERTAQLRESEEHYRTLAESAHDSIFILNRQGALVYINTHGAEFLRRPVSELLGKQVRELVSPFAYEGVPQSLFKVFEAGESVSLERALAFDGARVWLDTRLVPLRDEQGAVQAAMGIARDITAAKRAAEEIRRLNQQLEQKVIARTAALEESKNRFQQIIENLNEVMWIESVEPRKLLYVSPAFEKIWERSRAELAQQPQLLMETIFPEDRQLFKAHLRRQRQGEISEIEYRITRADGEMRWIRDRSFPIRDEQGNVYRTAGLAQDLTEQKREEENRQARTAKALKQQTVLLKLAQADNTELAPALQRLTEASANTLNVARVGVWLFNEERTAFVCADLFESEFKRHTSGQVLLLASYPRYFSALQSQRVIAAHEAQIDPHTSEFTENYLKPLGITAMLDVPIWQGGQVRGVLCHEHMQTPRIWTLEEQEFAASIADLTGAALEAAERKRAEAEVRRLNFDLEQRVSARTAELHESETRFRQLAENITEVFWLDHGDLSRTLYVSPAYEQIWGRTCQSLLEHPETWPEAIHPEDRAQAGAVMQQWLQQGMVGPYQATYRILRPDGGVRWIYNRAFPVRNATGEIYRIAGIAEDITTRKEAEEKLARTASNLQAILAALPDMYFRQSADGTFLDCSKPEDMEFLVAPEIFLGRKNEEILPPEISAAIGQAMQQTLRSRRLTTLEYNMLMPEGRRFYEARLAPFLDQEVIALVRDITVRKHAEQALRESEERYRTLAESAPDFVFIVDSTGQVRYINAFAASFFDCGPEAIIGKYAGDLFAPEHYARIWANTQTVFSSGKPLRLEGKVQFPGQALWLDVQLLPLHVEAGTVITVMGIARDFTERKWAEKELSATSSRLIALMENLQSGILFEDETRHVLYVNPKFCEAFALALAPAQLLGMNCGAACEMLKMLFVNAEEFVVRVEEIIATRSLVTNEELRLLDGRTFERDAVPVFVNEKFIGQLWRYRDITPRKKLEAQLLEHTTKLEEMVAARTQRIQELERQRAEEEKLAATGRMAARVAHEINNPLGTIKTAFRLVSRAIASEHRHYPMVGTIEKEIDRIAAIVRQMLDLHRPPQQEELQPLRADHSIREILDLMKPHAQEYGVTLDLNLTQAQTFIVLPESMLRQVLYNIVLNAIEASPPHGVVQVHAGVADTFLEIQVRDQGPGIPAEIAAQIFEPFFTTKSRSRTGGMGLGLSISKSLIEAVKGELTFNSKPGAGTTCRIVIPLA